MKRAILLLLLTVTISLSSQSLQTLTIQDNIFEYQTDNNGIVNALIDYKSTNESIDISDEDLRTLLVLSTYITKSGLKSSRSFVPISYTVKYKHSKKGKHKYSVQVYYTGTNSYGGEMNSLIKLEFNSKFKETLGSVLMRS